MSESFDDLVRDAEAAPFSGWDFSYLAGRFDEGTPSWDYRTKVAARMKGIDTMLDIGTGGGEVLSSLQPLPPKTFASEQYRPNVQVARERLSPLGVEVVEVESESHLPFESGYFDLIIDRHEEYSAQEVSRLLHPGGLFVTQQVGGFNMDELNQLLQKKVNGKTTHSNESWSLPKASAALRAAGLGIVESMGKTFPSFFHDVGAVVYFLKNAPWEVPDFDTKKYRAPLVDLHQGIRRTGSLKATSSRFYIEAVKPT